MNRNCLIAIGLLAVLFVGVWGWQQYGWVQLNAPQAVDDVGLSVAYGVG